MDRQFMLPISFAAAFHAALLFGFRPSSHTLMTVRDPARIVDPIFAPADLADPPEPQASTEPMPKSSPEPLRPDIAEVPHLPATEHDFTINVMPHPAVNVEHPVINLPPGGDDPRGKPGPNILSSVFLDSRPRTRAQTPPVYPFEAKRSGLTGTVTVEFIVDESGHVVDPHVIDSTDRVFEEPTLRAISKWRFEPGRKNDQIVRFRMSQPVMFNLD
jgi:periplasmic protein TonB